MEVIRKEERKKEKKRKEMKKKKGGRILAKIEGKKGGKYLKTLIHSYDNTYTNCMLPRSDIGARHPTST